MDPKFLPCIYAVMKMNSSCMLFPNCMITVINMYSFSMVQYIRIHHISNTEEYFSLPQCIP